jgi:preprotein translocase subunit SecG
MLDLLHTPITVLHVIVCLMLMLVVLIQPGKSGGLGAALGGAGAAQIFGGRGAGNFLTKTTWIAATVFFLTSVTLAYVSTSTGDSLQERAPSRNHKNLPVEDSTPKPALSDTAPAPGGAAPSAPAEGSAAPSSEPSAPTSEPSAPGSPPPAPGSQP